MRRKTILFSSSATRTHTSLNKAWEFWIHHYPLRTLASIQRLQKTVEPLLLQPTKDCVGGNCKVWQSLYKHNMREKGGFWLFFFFLHQRQKNTITLFLLFNSKFTPLSSSSWGSEIVAPPRILTSLCNFGSTTSISTSICWGFEVSNPISGLFWVHTIRLLDNCTFMHCKICSSIVFIRHLMRRSCEGDDQTSKEVSEAAVENYEKKEIKKCNI